MEEVSALLVAHTEFGFDSCGNILKHVFYTKM